MAHIIVEVPPHLVCDPVRSQCTAGSPAVQETSEFVCSEVFITQAHDLLHKNCVRWGAK